MARDVRPANCDHDMPRRSCRCCALALCRACFANTDCAGNFGGPHARPLDDMAKTPAAAGEEVSGGH